MPIFGLLSDSHGDAEITQRAVEVLLSNGAEVLIHLGDVGTVQVIDAMVVNNPKTGELVDVYMTFGNTDYEFKPLSVYAHSLGIHVGHPMGKIGLGEGELAFLHGDSRGNLSQLIRENTKYICHGHTHTQIDVRQGGSRIVNPGALTRAIEFTVAILDTDNDELRFYPVSKA